MLQRKRLSIPPLLLLALLVTSLAPPVYGQSLSKNERESGRMMLQRIKDEIKKNYFDPNFRGVNLDEQFKAAEEKINQASSNGQLFGVIAQAVLSLNDSHTIFFPPQRAVRVDYGWRIRMVGDKCYITAVKPGTDAEAQGLRAGDILHVVDGYSPTRENFWLLNYLYNLLQPRTAVQAVVQSPGGEPRRVNFNASVREGKKVLDLTSGSGMDLNDLIREGQEEDSINAHRFYEVGKELLIWKMPHFDLSKSQTDEVMDKAKNFKALILDLRDNGGGYEETLLRLAGNLFDHDVKIGDLKRRKEVKPLLVKARGGTPFQGQLILLVDSGSASAAELLARVVQLEKRGTVIGDRTAGAVMRSKGYSFQIGVDTIIPYGASITDADLIMTDGESLEKVGVTPDKLMLPSGAEMRAGADSVLAYAASLAGVKIEPEKAGALFPIRWKLKP
jgi:C-terminal processing protease CtpA/Prc